jgi:dipeptidyl aminopeptidase/acylaminoacyl peptidase
MPRHPITAEDLWALPRVGAPVPSPDGAHVLVTVSNYSMEANEGTTRIWIVPGNARNAGDGRAGDPARPLTTSELSSGQPCWSPDGSRIAFVRKPGGTKNETKGKPGAKYADQAQIYVMSLSGGEPERLTDLPLGVLDPRWFPDGRRIAFISTVFVDALDIESAGKRAKEIDENPVKVASTEDRFYRYWDHWLTDGKVHHIFVLDLDTRKIQDITPDSRRLFNPDDPTGQYRIAPDGSEITFAACRTRPPHDPVLWGVFTVPVPVRVGGKTGRVRALTDGYPADVMNPIYSPDGRWIVFGMQREFDFYADRVRLVAYDRGRGTHSALTERWPLSADSWSFAGDGRTLIISAATAGRTAIYRLDLGEALAQKGKAKPREILRGGSFSAPRIAEGQLFMSRSSLREPPEAFVCSIGSKKLRKLTGFTDPTMRTLQSSAVEEVIFAGADGDPVQMYLVYPPGVRPTPEGRRPPKRLPLVQLIHGGPHAAFGDEWHWRWNAQAFAAPGYVVALVNFHGSMGWGQDFAASILGRWGDQPYSDVMAATDYLIDRGIADPKRMAATGGSYGGYMAAWIASQTDRFAAIINHAGVCDFQTQYASDVTQGRARSMGGEPWDNVEGMDRYNPMRHAAGFRSPMLVIHGEKDYRVPHAQGIEIYNVYKAMRLPARLLCYPDENHWILKPRNSRHWYGEFLGWLDRWIGAGSRKRPRRSR